MNNNGKSQIENGRPKRPLHSPAFGAAWGRVLGLALLMIAAVPSYAGGKPALNKFSADLQSAVNANGMVTVNIQYRRFPTMGYLRTRQTDGAMLHRQLPSITAVTMTDRKSTRLNSSHLGI